MKHMPSYIQNQSNHEWKDEGSVKSIYNSNILVLGLGDIGKEFSKSAYAMGAHITGIKEILKINQIILINYVQWIHYMMN